MILNYIKNLHLPHNNAKFFTLKSAEVHKCMGFDALVGFVFLELHMNKNVCILPNVYHCWLLYLVLFLSC